MMLGDLREYVAIPRVTALRLAPDGSWLAAVVQTVGGEPPKYLSSIWRIDTAGDGECVRLTRSAEGEASPEFLPDGSLLFASKRPDPESGKKDAEASKDKPAVWLLPDGLAVAGGVARHRGGVPGDLTGVDGGGPGSDQDAGLFQPREELGAECRCGGLADVAA
jgi:dipeptidyl aminopeptidase/acylaminoacyl peptidase